jgi:DNA-binding MarR family transcriptional regulator
MAIVNQNRASAHGFDPRLFLRDEELDYGIALMLAAERALMREAGDLASAQNMPPLAARALIAIRFQPGQTVSQLRDQQGATTPTMARILGDLDNRGLVERRKSKQDARARVLYLTIAGNDMTETAATAMRRAVRTAYRDAGSDAVAGARAVLEALS